MFQLALRLWTGNEMIYPVKFSVMFDPSTKKSSVRAFVKNDKFITFEYMMITPFTAINGPIFEKDIIVVDGDEEHLKIVEFDVAKGIFIAKDINGDSYIKMDGTHKYETAGNTYEDKDLLGEELLIDSSGKTEELKEEEITPEIKEENKKSKKGKNKKEDKEQKKIEDNIHTPIIDVSIPGEKEKDIHKEEPSSIENEAPLDNNIPEEEEISMKEDMDTSVKEIVEENVEKQEEINKDNSKEIEIDMPEIDESEYLDNPLEKEEPNILVNKGDKMVMNIHFISVCGDNSKGGYAFTFECNNIKDTYKGSETDTNSKKIDLSGLIAALEMLDGKFDVVIYTTSQYVVYPFFKGWIHKWKESNWFKNDTDRIQNYELWSELYDFSEKYNIKWNFVDKLTDDMKECKKFAEEEIF